MTKIVLISALFCASMATAADRIAGTIINRSTEITVINDKGEKRTLPISNSVTNAFLSGKYLKLYPATGSSKCMAPKLGKLASEFQVSIKTTEGNLDIRIQPDNAIVFGNCDKEGELEQIDITADETLVASIQEISADLVGEYKCDDLGGGMSVTALSIKRDGRIDVINKNGKNTGMLIDRSNLLAPMKRELGIFQFTIVDQKNNPITSVQLLKLKNGKLWLTNESMNKTPDDESKSTETKFTIQPVAICH